MEEQDFFEDDFDNDYQDNDDNDYSSGGCGEGFSCNECGNYGCNAHPCN
ncbi:MAG: hypothetical protein LBL24_02975 [Bacteroidales bacterium]|jgi:hypothetical protein|nr:hypothetical protein [Bacteroidales bacterium]